MSAIVMKEHHHANPAQPPFGYFTNGRSQCGRLREIVLLIAALIVLQGGLSRIVFAKETTHDTRRSTLLDLSATTQALQRDDTQNPAMLWVQEGRALWSKNASNGTSCAGCHGLVESTMRGVAASYPKYSIAQRRVVNLSQQINYCHTRRQKQPDLAAESNALLSLETLIALQSRGSPISPKTAQPQLIAAQQRGATLYSQRIGQVDLSCKDCHDILAGKRLGGNIIPQAHPTGYPIYRLEWQGVGSLNRRLRNCITAVRADVTSYSAVDFVDIEAYLMQRAAGMKMESPSVRP
jgi:L-cysteine S-thiosulfotransferase